MLGLIDLPAIPKDGPEWEGLCDVSRTSRFTHVVAVSGRGRETWIDPGEFEAFLPPNPDPAELGAAIRTALAASRYVLNTAELLNAIKTNRWQTGWDAWRGAAAERYGYARPGNVTRRRFETRITLSRGEIVVAALRFRGSRGTRLVTSPERELALRLPAGVASERLGDAARPSRWTEP